MARGSLQFVPLVVAVFAGCGGNTAGDGGKTVSHLRAITALYFKASSSLGKNPANEQEFKGVISQGKMDLEVLGVGSVDELFISDRDGQPLAIIYGQPPDGVSKGVVAYERTGKDGVRQIGLTSGQVIEADAAQFAKLVSSPQS
jgi:hypothetical protein